MIYAKRQIVHLLLHKVNIGISWKILKIIPKWPEMRSKFHLLKQNKQMFKRTSETQNKIMENDDGLKFFNFGQHATVSSHAATREDETIFMAWANSYSCSSEWKSMLDDQIRVASHPSPSLRSVGGDSGEVRVPREHSQRRAACKWTVPWDGRAFFQPEQTFYITQFAVSWAWTEPVNNRVRLSWCRM